MPDFERHLKHEITVWRAQAGEFGALTYVRDASPVAGRWNETAELFRDSTGREVVSKVKVTLEVDVKPQDYLMWGTSAEADPRNEPGAYEVKQFQKTPDLRAEKFLRVAFI